MVHIIIGGGMAASLFFIIYHARNRDIRIKWWQWLLILTEFMYVVFVLAFLVSFLEEGAVKGALVMGTILGFVALATAFMIFRLILHPRIQ